MIKAVRGGSKEEHDKGDVAIDNVVLQFGPCSNGMSIFEWSVLNKYAYFFYCYFPFRFLFTISKQT